MLKKNSYFIGFGGNLGQVEQSFLSALSRLEQEIGIAVAISSLYKSEALQIDSSIKQADYLNCLAEFQTEKAEEQLFELISKIEIDLGRVRNEKWEARCIDLDLIACADRVYKSSNLVIPHAEMHKRSFVLAPFAEIAPLWQHPIFKKTALELLNALENPTPCKILKPFPRCEF